MKSRAYSTKEVGDVFEVTSMDVRSAAIYAADLHVVMAELGISGDRLDEGQYNRVLSRMADKWFERRAGLTSSPSLAPVNGRLIKAKEAAEHLGLTMSQFQKLAARGELPFIPVTGGVKKRGRYQHKRYRIEDLDRWVVERTVEGKP
ncbi:helix-turn-helix domain-containing protein [bacterium]|nr:helix-turn-helix domain-containing protein [bacterium]